MPREGDVDEGLAAELLGGPDDRVAAGHVVGVDGEVGRRLDDEGILVGRRMSGLLALIRLKASVVPGMAWFTTIAFIFGSSARATMLEMMVSCWDMKSSG
jgi:hypothetical protein